VGVDKIGLRRVTADERGCDVGSGGVEGYIYKGGGGGDWVY
jgi:hypothetical protein